MHDLGEAEDGILELVVEAVDEHKNVALGRTPDGAVRPGRDLLALDRIGAQGDEVGGRVARDRFRPLDRAGLADGVGWDRDREIGVGHCLAPLAREQHAAVGRGLAGRGDEHVDPRGARNLLGAGDGQENAIRTPRAGRQQGKRCHADDTASPHTPEPKGSEHPPLYSADGSRS